MELMGQYQVPLCLGLEDIRVARLKNAEKNVALFKFPKNNN